MVNTRMEARMDAVERSVAELRQQRTEDREVLVSRFSAVEGAVAALLQRMDEGTRRDADIPVRAGGGAARGDAAVGGVTGGSAAAASAEDESWASRRVSGTDHWRKLEVPIFEGGNAFDWIALHFLSSKPKTRVEKSLCSLFFLHKEQPRSHSFSSWSRSPISLANEECMVHPGELEAKSNRSRKEAWQL